MNWRIYGLREKVLSSKAMARLAESINELHLEPGTRNVFYGIPEVDEISPNVDHYRHNIPSNEEGLTWAQDLN